MKIYTKTGDKGQTSLIGGKRVDKTHARIEAYGTLDELIAYVGYLRDHELEGRLVDELVQVQDDLMVCSAILASDSSYNKIPQIKEGAVKDLEDKIDKMEQDLPPLKSFILPGGHKSVSVCHICRTLCRRAERRALALSHESVETGLVLNYLNRLSDYLFVLGRKLSHDLKAKEIRWKAKL